MEKTMIEIFIDNASSYQNLRTLKELLGGEKWKTVQIEMTYNPEKGLPIKEEKENWPFKANLVSEVGECYCIHIYTLTVGYNGSGPHDFADILDYFRIEYYHGHIFTKIMQDTDGYIRLHYER